MKKLLEFGNRYARQSTWKDFALTKFCLFSMGLGIGALVSERYKSIVIVVSVCVFIATYIPLIIKMLRLARRKDCE